MNFIYFEIEKVTTVDKNQDEFVVNHKNCKYVIGKSFDNTFQKMLV